MDDNISRQAAIDAFEARGDEIKPNAYHDYDYDMGRRAGLDTAADIIEALPPAEQRTGRWVKDGVDYGEEFGGVYEFWCCDCCGEGSLDRYNYCPHCGAKMEGDNDN